MGNFGKSGAKLLSTKRSTDAAVSSLFNMTPSFFGPDGWGPVSTSRSVLDFTVGFQDIVFVLIISVLFSGYAVAELVIHRGRHPDEYDDPKPEADKYKWLTTIKVLLYGVVICLLVAAIVLSFDQPPSTKLALAFQLLAFAIFGYLGLQMSRISWQTQISTQIFLLLVILSTAMRTRTEYTRLDEAKTLPDSVSSPAFAILISCIFGFVTVLFILENIPRISKDRRKTLRVGNQDVANLLSFATFWWMQPQMSRGFRLYRQQVLLEEKDLMEVSHSFGSEVVYTRFKDNWSTECQKTNPSIFKALARTYGIEYSIPLVIGLIAYTLPFAQPQLLNALISLIQSYNGSDSNNSVSGGYEIALGFLAAAVLRSILLACFMFSQASVGIKVRTTLMVAIYRKSLRLSPSAKRERTPGEMGNLMSVDAERFLFGLINQWEIVFVPYQLALAWYFLYQQLSYATFAGIAVIALYAPVPILFGKAWSKNQQKKMSAMDERNAKVNELVTNIKTIKLFNWEDAFLKKVFAARSKELKALRKVSILFTVLLPTILTIPNLVALVSFAVYAAIAPKDAPLDVNRIFVSISLFGIIQGPANDLANLLAPMMEMQVAFKRIKEFLLADELVHDTMQSENDLTTESTLDSGNEKSDNGTIVEGRSVSAPVAISYDGADFAWDKAATVPTLHDINLTVTKGKLVAVVGRVGVGKSSLLSGLVGDIYRTRGTARTIGKVAYCPQSPWIQNDTIKENILFGKDHDEKRLQEVIYACNLEPDLQTLAGGIDMEIGERGVNISGGQQARIALARAAYSDADILLLDDPFSALDAQVDSHLFEHLLGPSGLLKNKTRLIVTHSLQHLSRFDAIVVVADGQIAEQGTYEELVGKKGGLFQVLISDYSRPTTKKVESEMQVDEKESPEADEPSTPKEDPNIDKRAREEFVALGKVKYTVYFEYFKGMSWPIAIAVISMFALAQAAQTGAVSWLERYSNLLAAGAQPNTAVYLAVYGLLSLAMALFLALATYIFMAIGALKTSNRCFQNLARTVVRLPMSWFDTNPMGRVINRFSKDVFSLDEPLAQLMENAFPLIFQVIATIVVSATATPVFLAPIVPLVFVLYYVQLYYTATSRATKRLDSGRTRSPIYAFFLETINGASSVRAYGYTDRFLRQFLTRVDRNLHPLVAWSAENRWLSVRIECLGSFVTFFATVFVIVERHNISASLAALSVSYSLQITSILTSVVRLLIEVENEIVSLERIAEYTLLETEAAAVCKNDPPEDWPQQGAIEFQRYSTRYRKGMELALRDVSFKVGAGDHVGIVGRTGSGKSTIGLALFRILEAAASEGNEEKSPTTVEGKILIDGVDISQVGLSTLRRNLTIIPQSPVLFHGTLRDNIDSEHKHSDQELWSVLEASNLKTFVSGLEGQLDAPIEQGGGNFSAGQRQMISFARALLRKSKILILDEATSSTDMETNKQMQLTIQKYFADTTVLSIAHRISTVTDYDRILTMDNGQVVEYERPEVLLRDEGSLFFKFAKETGEI